MEYIKVFAFIPRRKDITSQAFHDHWRHPHATWGKQMQHIRRYLQNHQISTELLGAEQNRYEGIAEAWFESVEQAAAFGSDPTYKMHIGPDESHFIERDNLTYLAVTEEVLAPARDVRDPDKPDTLWSPWRAPVSIKLFQVFLQNHDSAWARSEDAGLGDQLRALRHVRCLPIDALNPPEGTRFVGLREMWWPTLSAFFDGANASREAWDTLFGHRRNTLLILTQSELGHDHISSTASVTATARN